MSKPYIYSLPDGKEIKTYHSGCPALVLRGGRCPRGCLQKSIFGSCKNLKFLDHATVGYTTTGDVCFISRHHGSGAFDGLEEFEELKRYCEWHKLNIKMELQKRGAPYGTHIIITDSTKGERV